MRKFLLVLGAILVSLVIGLVADHVQEGWIGIIACFLGYLLISGLFFWLAIQIFRIEAEMIFMDIWASIVMSLSILFFLWHVLLLLSDVSQGRQSIITAD